MNLVPVLFFMTILILRSTAQSAAKSILFTDPQLDPERCSQIFSLILQREEFRNLPLTQIKPIFLNLLEIPASMSDLNKQFNIIQNETIYVEIGPDYFYGPSFFRQQLNANSKRATLIGFDLNYEIQSSALEAAFKHLTKDIGVVKLAYVYKNTEGQMHPFEESLTFQFLKEIVGQLYVYYMSDFVSYEDALSKILVDGANVLVLNVEQATALKILHQAEEKNVLQHPFYWLIFNAGITMSGEGFNVQDTNFFAIEFSTNGGISKYPELDGLTKPITPKDLIFRDMAVTGLLKLGELLSVVLADMPLITSTLTGLNGSILQQTWNFYSYTQAQFDVESLYKVDIYPGGVANASFQNLEPTPEAQSLLERMRQKPLRLGTVLVPPLVTEVTNSNGEMEVSGPEITVARELLNRLNVSYNITVFDSEIGENIAGQWTGVFERLMEWDIDLLVGPFSLTGDRSADFQSTTPFRSISYKFMYHRPFLKASVQIFQFVVAFHGYTWLVIFITALVFAGALALLHKISPNTLSYDIHPSMIFVFGYLFQGVRTRPPSRASSQVIIIVWWFFCLVLVIAFCANYAAYRSYTALENLPTTVSTLLHQEYYKYAYIRDSTTEVLMNEPLDPAIYALYEQINTKFQDFIPPNRSVGIDHTIKGKFALLDESPFIDYYSKKYCLETSQELWYGAYVFYMPKLMPYYQILNDELALMIADGTIENIFKQGEKELYASLPPYCGATFKDQAIEAMRNPLVNWSDYSIEFAAAFGIFIISIGGLLIVIVVLLIEYFLGVYKKTPES